MNQPFQRSVSLLAGGVSSLCLFFLSRLSSWWSVALVLCVWFGIVCGSLWYLIHRRQQRKEPLFLLFVSMVSLTLLASVVEEPFVIFTLVVVIGIITAFLFESVWLPQLAFSSVQKPFRRMKMMLWALNTFALVGTLYAFGIFFPSIPYWVVAFVGAAVCSLAAVCIWRMYVASPQDAGWQLGVWVGIMFFSMMEIIWVMLLFPFGYLVMAALTTWVWYVLQLFIRFHISSRDILWKKQRWFLLSNAFLFVLALFFVQWS